MQYNILRKLNKAEGKWAKRLYEELLYVSEVSRVNGEKFDAMICGALNKIDEKINDSGLITKEFVYAIEEELKELSPIAKEIEVLCMGHAHIDMNWMWGYQETVDAVICTVQTALMFLEEYPDFKFSLSQANVYAIVAKYRPDMLQKIKQYVKEGRWEVIASTWVENDMNLPDGESIVRQILYAKKYLSVLLDIAEEEINVNFQPDTFGHNANVPEIMKSGGVDYYYFAHGMDDAPAMFWWEAPSGERILAYHERTLYSKHIENTDTHRYPEHCKQYGINKILYTYGFGDHGGGPTRKDIEQLFEYNKWPLLPTFKFSTYAEFFAEAKKANLTTIKRELNPTLTGAYSSMQDIKRDNKVCTNLLYQAEFMRAYGKLLGLSDVFDEQLREAWQNVLFAHFHDIMAGTINRNSNKYVSGKHQESAAIAQNVRNFYQTKISENIDFSAFGLKEDGEFNNSEGAGMGICSGGMGMADGSSSVYCVGTGKNRLYTVFNGLPYQRKEIITLWVWDWFYDRSSLIISDDKGNRLPYQIVDGEPIDHWYHKYFRVYVEVEVPSMGYMVLLLTEGDAGSPNVGWPNPGYCVDPTYNYTMENDLIKVVFSNRDCSLISVYDKRLNKEVLDRPTAFLELVREDSKWMTSWFTGNYASIQRLTEFRVLEQKLGSGLLVQSLRFVLNHNDSVIEMIISLEKNSPVIRYHFDVLWKEFGALHNFNPMLSLNCPLSFHAEEGEFDIPNGTIKRTQKDEDCVAINYAYAEHEDRGMLIVPDCRHGFRYENDNLRVVLLRSSCDPDPIPEIGKHTIDILLSPVKLEKEEIYRIEGGFNRPLAWCTAKNKKGALPTSDGLFTMDGKSVRLVAFKLAEDEENCAVLRFSEYEGKDQIVSMKWNKGVKKAIYSDLLENDAAEIPVCGREFSIQVKHNALVTVKVYF